MSTKTFSKIGGINCQRKIKSFTSDKVIPRTIEFNPDQLTAEEHNLVRNDKFFSASSVKDRLVLMKLNPRVKLARQLRDYKTFYKSNSAKLSAEDFELLGNLFVTDIMGVLNSIVDQVVEGTSLVSILGLGSIGHKAMLAGKLLSPVYIKALQAEKAMGSVPKAIYEKLTLQFNSFISVLKSIAFELNEGAGVLEVNQSTDSETV